MRKRKLFGGLVLDLREYKDVTLKEIFGKKLKVTPTELNKILWRWIKRRKKKIFVKI